MPESTSIEVDANIQFHSKCALLTIYIKDNAKQIRYGYCTIEIDKLCQIALTNGEA